MEKLTALTVASNVSEAYQLQSGGVVVLMITTTGSSVVVLKTSADGTTYSTNPNFEETINGTAEFNIPDLKKGQYIKLEATSGTLTAVKVLD